MFSVFSIQTVNHKDQIPPPSAVFALKDILRENSKVLQYGWFVLQPSQRPVFMIDVFIHKSHPTDTHWGFLRTSNVLMRRRWRKNKQQKVVYGTSCHFNLGSMVNLETLDKFWKPKWKNGDFGRLRYEDLGFQEWGSIRCNKAVKLSWP